MQTCDWLEAAKRLAGGEVGVVPTDTLYGIVGSALKPAAVERVYELRRRELDKPMIVLIAGWTDFERLQIEIPARTQELLNKVWPGPVSVIVAVASPALAYLHRGTNSLAFRMPNHPELRELLERVGPVVAPSANVAGEKPSETVEDARAYFGDEIFYVEGGKLSGSPSALVDARPDPMRVLRPAPGFRL